HHILHARHRFTPANPAQHVDQPQVALGTWRLGGGVQQKVVDGHPAIGATGLRALALALERKPHGSVCPARAQCSELARASTDFGSCASNPCAVSGMQKNVPCVVPCGVFSFVLRVYSSCSPGCSSGCLPTAPRPRTSSAWPGASVITQCRPTSCA